MASIVRTEARGSRATFLLKMLLALFCIYLFLVGIMAMGSGAKMLSEDVSKVLIRVTSNPLMGLFVGVLSTAIIQSSSATTSIAVGLVAEGMLKLPLAVPIIMGANIGTSVTNLLVSLTHITRKDEFRRAFSGAIVHDLFNLMTVAVLFPLEMTTHYLERTALVLTRVFAVDLGGAKVSGPLDQAVQPLVNAFRGFLTGILKLHPKLAGVLMGVLGLVVLFVALWLLVKVLRGSVLSRLEPFFDRVLFRNALISFLLGLFVTATIQSSSVTTSLIVPLVGAGVLTLEQIYPYTLGANIGTTVTAIIASLPFLAKSPAGLTLALVHLLFNVSGTAIFYPLRVLPIGVARWYARLAADSKIYALLFLVCVFFVIPVIGIVLYELLHPGANSLLGWLFH